MSTHALFFPLSLSVLHTTSKSHTEPAIRGGGGGGGGGGRGAAAEEEVVVAHKRAERGACKYGRGSFARGMFIKSVAPRFK
jgi:hypothetical protein